MCAVLQGNQMHVNMTKTVEKKFMMDVYVVYWNCHKVRAIQCHAQAVTAAADRLLNPIVILSTPNNLYTLTPAKQDESEVEVVVQKLMEKAEANPASTTDADEGRVLMFATRKKV